jgi:hypothetical protein
MARNNPRSIGQVFTLFDHSSRQVQQKAWLQQSGIPTSCVVNPFKQMGHFSASSLLLLALTTGSPDLDISSALQAQTHRQYSVIADLYTFQFTVVHALGLLSLHWSLPSNDSQHRNYRRLTLQISLHQVSLNYN